MKAALAAKHLVDLGPDALGQHAAVVGSTPPLSWDYRALRDAYDDFSPGHEAEFWLLVVHHLGWKQGAREKFSARREIWAFDDSSSRWHEVPYEPEALARHLALFKGGPPEFLRRITTPADCFYSVLPDDVFRSSKYALDMVIRLNTPEPEPVAEPPVWSRIKVDLHGDRISLDDVSYEASHQGCLYVDALRKARGHLVSFKKILGLEKLKVDRVRDLLPEPIRKHIESDRGKGSRFKADQVD